MFAHIFVYIYEMCIYNSERGKHTVYLIIRAPQQSPSHDFKGIGKQLETNTVCHFSVP